MYVSWNDFFVGGGALFVRYSTDNGVSWTNARQLTSGTPFIRYVQVTGDLATGDVYVAGMNENGGGLTTRNNLMFRSTDGGNTWANTYTGPTFNGPGVALRASSPPCITTLLTGDIWAGESPLRLTASFTTSKTRATRPRGDTEPNTHTYAHINSDTNGHSDGDSNSYTYTGPNYAQRAWLPGNRATESGLVLERSDFDSCRYLSQRRVDRHSQE